MKIHIVFICLLIASLCKAAPNIKIYYEQVEDGFNIYADNHEFSPVSVIINFTVENLRIDGKASTVYIVDPKEQKQLLTALKVTEKGKAYRFSYKYHTNYGIHNNRGYDRDYIYDLPFKKDNAFKVNQGYNGSFSHQNENSLDFTMPVGTEVVAVRKGVVVEVIDEHDKNCGSEDCKKYNNLILIYHPDGTFAEYVHIKQNGSAVNVGDTVSKGQLIAYSGNVGWSTGPHLHLVVFNQNIDGRETLKTKFKTGNGSSREYLIEKEIYTRDY